MILINMTVFYVWSDTFSKVLKTVISVFYLRYEFPWSPWKLIPFYGGAAYHDYHHFVGGKCHTNFASVFTYCDFIYGTNKVLFTSFLHLLFFKTLY